MKGIQSGATKCRDKVEAAKLNSSFSPLPRNPIFPRSRSPLVSSVSKSRVQIPFLVPVQATIELFRRARFKNISINSPLSSSFRVENSNEPFLKITNHYPILHRNSPLVFLIFTRVSSFRCCNNLNKFPPRIRSFRFSETK